MGIEVPRNTREALLFDKQNKNTLWADAIYKEMSGLKRLNVFKFHAPNYKCNKKEGWQFSPMHMIFDIKQQDLRYKARLVVGGHVIDSSDYTTYSSVIENLSVRLLFLAAAHQGLGIMTGDIGNAHSPQHHALRKYGQNVDLNLGHKKELSSHCNGHYMASKPHQDLSTSSLVILL
jgi:hypothetical protein